MSTDREHLTGANTAGQSALIEPLDLPRRLGKFAISCKLLLEKPDMVMRALNNCIVVRCELLWEYDAFSYVALSPLFDVVPAGQIANDYQIRFTEYSQAVHFERV